MKKKPKKVVIGVPVTVEQRGQVYSAASREGRTVAGWVRRLILKALAE
jgi:hypothetical protein